MAMTNSGGARGFSSDINVTPLIDVLLVLLIVFMVISPVTPKGVDASVPQPAKSDINTETPRTIVLQVVSHPGGVSPTYRINEQEVAKSELLTKLTSIFATRAERVMFVRGDEDIEFGEIAQVIDIGHAAGVDRIGLMTPKVEAGQ